MSEKDSAPNSSNSEQSLSRSSSIAGEFSIETILPIKESLREIAHSAHDTTGENREQTRYIRESNTILRIISISTTVIAIAIILAGLYLIKNTATLLLFSFLIAYVLSPVVKYAERRGVNRLIIILILTLFILSSVIFAASIAIKQVQGQVLYMQSSEWKSDLAASGIAYVERLPESAQYLLKSMANVFLGNVDSPKQEVQDILIQSSIDKIEVFLRNQSEEVINTLTSSAKGLFSAFTTGIIVFFLTFFMLNSGEEIKKTFIRIVPNRFFEPFLVLLDGLNRQLGDYLRSRVIQTILLSTLCAIGYWVLGLKFALILGFIAGLANLIPYIGPFIGAIPAVIIALIEIDTRFGFGWSLIGIGLITIAVQVIDNAVIFPLLIGKSVELGPITTIVVVLLGEQFFGFIGLLMAVPITAMIKLTISEVIVQFNGYSRSIIHGQ